MNLNLTLTDLEDCFKKAKEDGDKFIGIKISMGGFPSPEIIINDYQNFDKKLEYYKKAYNEDLTLKNVPTIKIVDFAACNTFNDIQMELSLPMTLPEICMPVAEFLEERYNPHTEIIISTDNIKVVTAQMGMPIRK